MPMAIAVRDGEVRNTRLLFRGDLDRPGEEVPRGFLSVIEHVDSGKIGTDSSGRLALADWIANEQNPLTARVMVNRIWLHLFGRGLVNTPDNFGSMGETPSNSEMLDYLASQFMTNGWSTKKMIRRLMLTSTYQLSSAYNSDAHTTDPENRLYWRMNRKRLDAESLRDSILAVNQSLDRTVGGDKVPDLTDNGRMPDGRPVSSEVLISRRRSLYLPIFRGQLNDLYQVFDFPDPNSLSGKRYVTTAPTQALFLMNSPFIAGESRRWAERLESKSESDLINNVYFAAYARPCSEEERTRATTFLRNYGNALIATESDQAIRRKKALQALCQAIIESTEFRFLN